MPLRVYNTLSRKKEAFVPLHGKRVSMFVCGITPQDQTHLGHAKTYVAFDVVARYLRSKGYHVFYLQNVTDIEDRIIAKMKSTRRAWDDIVAQYFAEFRDVMERLQCTSVDVYAFATDYIDEIVEQIQGLIRKGHAYVAEDKSVYFDTTTFSGWGKLSGQKVEELRPGARIEIEERKRHPADFVLWRAQKPGEPAWESPWGPGRPGWHIEDTAITIRHFGVQYDLHGGGAELAFPHHEAEIAQAESFTGVTPFVRYWMHGGMVMVSGAEMHKSLGNFWPVQAALERYEPEVLRFFLINVQYRGPIDFAPELLEEAKRSYERLRETVRSVEAERRRAPPKGKADPGLRDATKNSLAAFDAAMSDDFNTREAIAVLFEFARDVNKAIESGVGRGPLDGAAEAFRTFGDVLGLFQMKPSETDRLDGVLDLIVGLREDARKRKDFATADRIRDALAAVGIVLEDARDGVRWKLK
ncbi:MAG: cysteine--tRNA ligase [Methanobacteriota archaeon]|nr:MAG: cysteine--tRNA ligase [Euryarchaeota archaeon]